MTLSPCPLTRQLIKSQSVCTISPLQVTQTRLPPANERHSLLPRYREPSSCTPLRKSAIRSYASLSCRNRRPAMAPSKTDLEKQYMSTKPVEKKPVAVPRPSSSILLISPTNEILLLSRVNTSSSFASAHVFPGGNLDPTQDGDLPAVDDPLRHFDGPTYRLGAVRECFEESGILLARKKGDKSGELLQVDENEREKARKEIHGGKIRFEDWVERVGGEIDAESLIPFTRWVTPTNLPKRFTTQMYLYFLPLQASVSSKSTIPVPTHDGGLEHATAAFSPCSSWLHQAKSNQIILFPPQYYLMHLLAPFLTASSSSASSSSSPPSNTELQRQRDAVLEFLDGDGDGMGVKWAFKVMSPTSLLMRKSDGRVVLALDKPGPELKGSGRKGDTLRVVLVKFGKGGPRDVEVRWRKDVLDEERTGEESKL